VCSKVGLFDCSLVTWVGWWLVGCVLVVWLAGWLVLDWLVDFD
jgi:hypothetical protein